MEISYYNRHFLDDELYIHDSIFTGFSYDYDKKHILLKCQNLYLNKVFNFAFNNVIVTNMQTCGFWGIGANAIYAIDVLDKFHQLDELMELKKTKPDWFNNSALDTDKLLIIVQIIINSGDTITIVCSTVDFNEKVLDESKPVRVLAPYIRDEK